MLMTVAKQRAAKNQEKRIQMRLRVNPQVRILLIIMRISQTILQMMR